VLAWLRLLRLPNVFTAIADILMGWFVAKGIEWRFESSTATEKQHLALLVISSVCLYLAGMVLNDVWDYQEDSRDRPMRPLPSGQISLSIARQVGLTLLTLGILSGWAATFVSGHIWSGITATALAAVVVAYDIGMKRTAIGPLVMGSCRWLNVLLGMTSVEGPWPMWQLVLAAGLGIYVTGITIFANGEATISARGRLIAGVVVMLAGVAIIWGSPIFLEPHDYPTIAKIVVDQQTWNIAWLVLAALIGMNCAAAIADPKPSSVQRGVVQSLRSIIILDALACFTVCDVYGALFIIPLIVPTMLIGRAIYST
jgi:4-hydroxybenzoate polyprenyltransferase